MRAGIRAGCAPFPAITLELVYHKVVSVLYGHLYLERENMISQLSPRGTECSATASGARLAGQLWFHATRACHQHCCVLLSALWRRGQWRISVNTVASEINTKFLFWSISSCIFTATNKPDTDKHCATAVPGRTKIGTILYPHSA